MNLNLPFWLGGETLKKLKFIAEIYWGNIIYYINECSINNDPETCSENILNMLAWERSVKRIDDEPIPLFRKRVKFSLQNAHDAGSVAGFYLIFDRLGLNIIEQKERVLGEPVDRIFIEVQSLEDAAILQAIINQYGRTCREYVLTKTEAHPFSIRQISTHYEKQTIRLSS